MNFENSHKECIISTYQEYNCLIASFITIPKLTETFKQSVFPLLGINN